jgi:hypothetical protein
MADLESQFGEHRPQHAVEREAHVSCAIHRFSFLRGSLQAPYDAERLARPQVAIAADMLHVQARVAVRRPVAAEIAVSVARAANAVRENHQRHRAPCCGLLGPVQARRH